MNCLDGLSFIYVFRRRNLKVKPENWRVGQFLAPVLIVGDVVVDLYSIITDNFDHRCSSWSEMLKLLNINEQDLISEFSQL
jgi:hypothetical protein